MRAFLSFWSFVLVACGGVVSGGNDGGGGGSSDGGSAPGNHCTSNKDCSSTSYCDRGGSCGTSGTCKARPSACTDLYSPTCGCDGKIYGNPCSMNGPGIDQDATGKCPAPQGYIACGDKYCPAGLTYCQRTGNDVGGPGEPKEFDSCPMLPQACMGKTDCSCFGANQPCTCKAVSGGFEVFCPGG